jgi:hypothetical protein
MYYKQHVTSIPDGIEELEIEHCTVGQIKIPDSCTRLVFYSNDVDTLPALPASLKVLNCQSNYLTHLPSLPPNLKYLNCTDNLLTRIPDLPESMIKLISDGDVKVELNYDLSCWRDPFGNLDTRGRKLIQYNKKREDLGLEPVNKMPTRQEWNDINARHKYRVDGEVYREMKRMVV